MPLWGADGSRLELVLGKSLYIPAQQKNDSLPRKVLSRFFVLGVLLRCT